MRKSNAWRMALGGMMAALAMVIMCLGTLIPLSTFVCSLLCCLVGAVVLRLCGKRVGWAWYAAVAILSLLLSPDKEAATVYVMFGYYPMLKAFFDKLPMPLLFKLLYFNLTAFCLYSLIMYLLGMSHVLQEYGELGAAGFVVFAIAGNVTFLLLDLLLKRIRAGDYFHG